MKGRSHKIDADEHKLVLVDGISETARLKIGGDVHSAWKNPQDVHRVSGYDKGD
jgi:hypothetical protein